MKPNLPSAWVTFYLIDEDNRVVDKLTPRNAYSEQWIWDVLRIRAKDSAGVTLLIEDAGFSARVDEHWTLALKSFGQSADAVRLIRRIVESHESFEDAEVTILTR